jgi:hypothetical protein
MAAKVLPKKTRGVKNFVFRSGAVSVEEDEFQVVFEVRAVDVEQKPWSNLVVVFKDDKFQKIEQGADERTDEEGRAYCVLNFPLSDSGRKVTVNVEVYDQNGEKLLFEGRKYVVLPPVKYEGWKKLWELIKDNWKKENKIKMVSKVVFMYTISGVLLYAMQWAGLRWSALPVAIAIIFGIAALPGKFTLGLGASYAGVFLLVSMVVPELTVGAISSAAYMYLLIGPPTYIYEELSHREKEEERNVYPWLMLKLCWIIAGFYVGYGVYTLALGHDAYLDSMRSFLENDAIRSYAKDAMLEGAYKFPKLQHLYAYILKGKEFVMSLIMAASWIFASAIIFVPTSFGEFKKYLEAKMSGKEAKGVSAGHVGIYLILDTLLDIAIKAKVKKA